MNDMVNSRRSFLGGLAAVPLLPTLKLEPPAEPVQVLTPIPKPRISIMVSSTSAIYNGRLTFDEIAD